MSTPTYASQSESYQSLKVNANSLFANLYRRLSGLAKRAFDLTFSFLGLVFLSPFFVYIALLIRRDSPGPVFYWGPRVGRNGFIFNMLKFRTMYECPESYRGSRLTVKGDPRITPLGKWLRDTKINELPQLWNVLIGGMSLVGPRPEDPEIAKSWPEEARQTIFSIRPGITSPASILYHDEEELLSSKGSMSEYYESILPEKIRLDLLYVRHHSFFCDLDTIFWTLFIIVPRWANYKIPEGYVFAGPFYRLIHRYFSWFMIDLLGSLAVVGIVAILWRIQMPLNWGVEEIAFLGLILAILFSSVNSVSGLNRIVWSQANAGDAFGLIISGSFVTVLILGLNYFNSKYHALNVSPLPVAMILMLGLLSQACFVVTRYRLRLVPIIAKRWLTLRRNTLVLGERVLVVGNSEAGQIATWLLSRSVYRTAFSVVGLVDVNDPTKHGMKVNGYWILGGLRDIPGLIERYDVGIILSTVPASAKEVNEYVFDLCQKQNKRLIFLNDLMLMVDRQVTQTIGSFEYPIWLDERLEFKAMHDAITGLPNRYLFLDLVNRSIAYARRYNSQLVVLFIKIERKNIKTGQLGRRYGDQILIEATNRLIRCARGSDTLAYVGKNKFAIILENIANEDTPEVVSRRIQAILSEPVKIEGLDVQTQIKIDICRNTEGFDDFKTQIRTEIEKLNFTEQQAEALKRNDTALVG
jgi:diguanylate cyclase (GGDEF)-like protein